MTNAEHYVFLGEDPEYIGPPIDQHEADRVEWIPLSQVSNMIEDRQIVAGVAVVGLLRLLSKTT
jgi:hypothetical protein